MSDLGSCSACKNSGQNKAHVRDKSSFPKGHDDTTNNIVILCRTCHYEFFDDGKMLLAKCKCGKFIFVKMPLEGGAPERVNSRRRLSVRSQYLETKAQQALRPLFVEYVRIKNQCTCSAGSERSKQGKSLDH